MMILSRKQGETIIIGDNIRVTISEVIKTGSVYRVKLGITAPDEIEVDREEVREEKDKNRRNNIAKPAKPG